MNLMVASSQQRPGYLASIKPDWKKPDPRYTIESIDLAELVADCVSRSLWNTPEFHNICSDDKYSKVVGRLIRKAVIALNAYSAFPCVNKAFFKVWPKALAGGDILLTCYREKFEFLDGQKFSILCGMLEPRNVDQDGWPLRWPIRNLITNKPTLDVMRIAIKIDKVDECYRGSARPTFIGILILLFFISAASFVSRFLIQYECSQNNGSSTRNATNPVLGYICNRTNIFEETTLGIGGLFLMLGVFTLFSVGSVAVRIFECCQRKVLHPERYERIGTKRQQQLLPFDRNDEVDTSVIRSTWNMSSDSSQVYSYNFESMDQNLSTDDEPFIRGHLVINDSI
jgi:hypothetical protein